MPVDTVDYIKQALLKSSDIFLFYECKEWHINPETFLDVGAILQYLISTEPAMQEKKSPREESIYPV